MTGMLVSDSTTVLSTHHRPARENSSSSHSDYHSHSSHSCCCQPPLYSTLPTHQSSPPNPSLSSSSFRTMSDRPTLPGIASILAFAGQYRPARLSSPATSHSPRLTQSSDPVAHVLPASINIPPFPKTPPVANQPSAPNPREPATSPGYPRRSSSVTVVDADKCSPTYTHRAPPLPQHLRHILSSTCPPTSKDLTRSPPPIPAPPSFQKICHETTHQSNEEERVNTTWKSSRSMSEAQRSYSCNRRWDLHESSSHYRNHHNGTDNQSFESSSQMSVSPEIILASKLGGPTTNNVASGPQNHRYQCMEVGCGKTFSRPSSLKIHSYSHTGQKPFKCMRCDRAFSVQSNLKRHQKVHEKRSMYSRGICGNSNGTTPMMPYENGSGCLLEGHSAEEDVDHDLMEE